MIRHSQIITAEIRDEILLRSSFASSHDEMTRAIFDALVEADIDWRTVPGDEIKHVLIEALRRAEPIPA